MDYLSHFTEEQRQAHKEFCAMLKPVKSWLRDGAKHVNPIGFNMNYTHAPNYQNYQGETCGTVMCIGGAVSEFNNLGYGNEALDKLRNMFEPIQDRLGSLFYPETSNAHWDDITPEQALKAIENFEKRGTAMWDTIC